MSTYTIKSRNNEICSWNLFFKYRFPDRPIKVKEVCLHLTTTYTEFIEYFDWLVAKNSKMIKIDDEKW